jgi:hypothetical protein
MTLTHAPLVSARHLIALGKRYFHWTVDGPLEHHLLATYFFENDSTLDDLEAGIEYGVENGWLVVESSTEEHPTPLIRLTALGDAQ